MRSLRVACIGAALGLAGIAAAADKSGARANVVSLPRGPGSIEGLGETFEVDLNSGSVSETVKLFVPPGTAGLAPSLALSYNSGVGNGPLGIGWSLGTSTIQVKTDRGLPRYDADDRFMLDGGELVATADGVYRLKNEGRFVRVRRGGTHWEVDSPDGLVNRFGLSASARVESGTQTFSWALEETVDRFGNRIVYSYEKHGGDVYLSSVAWNARAGAADNQIAFEYEDRPDPVQSYRATFAVTTAKRLRLVSVFARGTLVRRYRLDYGNETGLSLLKAVTEVGSDDVTALPPVTFQYSPLGAPVEPRAMQNVPAAVPNPAGGNAELLDVDGDSFVDLLQADAGAHAYYLNQGGLRFSPRIAMPWSPSLPLSAPDVDTGDLNGDGLADLIAKSGSGATAFRFFPNLGRGQWEPSVAFADNPPFAFGDPNVRMLDFDNDKLIDVVQSTPIGLIAYRNTGQGRWDGPLAAPTPPGGTTIDFADARLKLADMNGDGLLDIVFARSGSILYWPHRGFAQFDGPRSIAGAPDVGTLAEDDLVLADVNGDGLTDVLFVGTSHVDYWPLRPNDVLGQQVTLQGTPYRDPSLTAVRLADVNGNGTIDLIWSTPSAPLEQRFVYLDLVGEARPNLLTSVHNGLGKVSEFVYTDSGLEYLRAREAGNSWSTRLPFPVQVLAKSAVSDGLGHIYVTGYSYRDGLYAADTREFRGFAHAEKLHLGDEASPSSVEAFDFDLGLTHQALKGRQTVAETRTLTGTVLKKETREWDVATYATGTDGTEVAGARLRKRTTYQVEGSSAPTFYVDEYEYDGFGNVIRQLELGAVGTPHARGGRDGRLITSAYANDEAQWLLRFPATIVTADDAGARLGEIHFHYDGEPFVGLPIGQVTHGAVSRKAAWVAGSRFIDLERHQRDEFGNVVVGRQPNGLERKVTFDSHHTFPIEERVDTPAGTWRWTASHDPGTGAVLNATDPTGALSQARYDALGRPVAIAKSGDSLESPTEWFEYKLGNPISELWTHTRLEAGTERAAITVTLHDGFGRKLRTAQNVGDRWAISGLAEYTALAQIVRQYSAFFADTPKGAPPSGLGYDSYAYDAAGRIILHKRPDGTLLKNVVRPLEHDEYDADDNDPSGTPLPRTVRINRRDKVYEVVDRLRDAQGAVRELLYALNYDAEGRVRTVTDPDGHIRRLSYDGLGRLIDVEDPDSGRRQYVYDDEGNLISLTTELGTVVNTYDLFNRPLTEVAVDPHGVEQARATYHYDEPPPGSFGGGSYATRLSRVEDAAGEEQYRYDGRGNVIGMRRIIGGESHDVLFAFDSAERLASVTYPSGETLDFTVDELGRTVSIPGLLHAVDYDAHGSIASTSLANGVSESRSYDALHRLTTFIVVSGSTKLRDATLAYDGRSNLREIADSAAPALSARYVYDDLSRLVAADVGGRHFSYAFADDGNFTSVNGEPATYDPSRPHAIASIGAATFTHGAHGALVGWDGKTGTFDAFGRLRTVETEKGTVKLTYAFDGRLVIEEGPDGRHIFPNVYREVHPDGAWNVAFLGKSRLARFRFANETTAGGCGSAEGSGTAALALLGWAVLAIRRKRPRSVAPPPMLRARWLMSGAALTAWIGCQCGGGVGPQFGEVFFVHHDTSGSSNFTTDRDGKASSVTSYAPFGKALGDSTEKHLFNGRYTSGSIGLSFWPQRALAPSSGRWNMPDVDALEKPADHILSPQGLNPYVYAANNPVSFADNKGAYEEPIHGALTYHLAIKAGFTESEATQIALACAGVDHNKKTAPTPGLIGGIMNLRSGITEHYHFADPKEALRRVDVEIAKGGKLDLNRFGVAMHTLEDVGFVDALGPHMRGTKSDGLNLVNNGKRGGHPTFRTQEGSLSEWHNKFADQPYRDYDANVKTLDRVYDVLARAAQARHPGVAADEAGARALIREVVGYESEGEISSFVRSKPINARGGVGQRSYENIVLLNYATQGSDANGVRWRSIDSSIRKE